MRKMSKRLSREESIVLDHWDDGEVWMGSVVSPRPSVEDVGYGAEGEKETPMIPRFLTPSPNT